MIISFCLHFDHFVFWLFYTRAIGGGGVVGGDSDDYCIKFHSLSHLHLCAYVYGKQQQHNETKRTQTTSFIFMAVVL